MSVILDNFSYYFSLTGSSGGLYSTECRFKLLPDGDGNTDGLKSVTRRVMHTYTDVLDRLYGEGPCGKVIAGKKEPLLVDSPHHISTGYQYSGNLTKHGLNVLDERLREMFGNEAVDPRGEISVHQRLRVTIECSFGKRGCDLDDVGVVVKHAMNHVLNVCFFRFTKRLKWIEVGKDPHTSMDNLERVLENTTKREGLDYFEMMTKQ